MRHRNSAAISGLLLIMLLCGLALRPAAAGDLTTTTRVDPPAGPGAMAPNLTVDEDGLLLSWLEPMPEVYQDDEGRAVERPPGPIPMRMRFASFDGQSWSSARTVVAERDFFANWADLPSVTRGPDGALLAHWLESAGEHVYAYHIMLARSTDDGESWNVLGRAHPDDDSETEHGFVSSVVDDDGIRLFWLDGRDMAGQEDVQTVDPHDPHGHAAGDMQLRTAVISGDSVGASVVLDDRVCECCDTAAAMTSRGPVVVYRDLLDGQVRDISIVRRVDGRWTEPQTVHDDGWGISGCPVNGPAVDARDEVVAVAWFTGADFESRVQVAFSEDAGASFAEPIKIDGDASLGRVDLVMTGKREAIITWLTTDAMGGIIRAQRVSPDGPVGEAVDVARTNPGRMSGFPRIGLAGEKAVVVRTHPDRPSEIHASIVDP